MLALAPKVAIQHQYLYRSDGNIHVRAWTNVNMVDCGRVIFTNQNIQVGSNRRGAWSEFDELVLRLKRNNPPFLLLLEGSIFEEQTNLEQLSQHNRQ